ncbi:MAG: hypothetical protein WBG90_09980 [Saonia sp.]
MGENQSILFKFIIPAGIVLVGLLLSFTTDILRDKTIPNKPYSFARVQLMWWTLIIVSCYTSYYGIYGALQDLDSSALILLGISIGTTTAARIIDNNEINRGINRDKKNQAFNNMVSNIISDANGISVHRFQAVVFNLVFGLMFIAEFLDTTKGNKFVAFSAMELGLMGISSAAYVGLKLNENSHATAPSSSGMISNATGAVAQEDFGERELRDIDETYSREQSDLNVRG